MRVVELGAQPVSSDDVEPEAVGPEVAVAILAVEVPAALEDAHDLDRVRHRLEGGDGHGEP